MSFKEFENNIHSQFGEDGVIEEIFNRIGTKNKICVEFGAWDGIHFSNTWNLWYNKDWRALLIEGDAKKCETLIENTKFFNKVTPLNLFVSFEGENSLDIIFEKHLLPNDIDCLSIDIDGDDYYILESLKNFRPRVILVEYNPTIPSYIEAIQKKGEYFGCSALSLLNLATHKGYTLIHMTVTNMLFITNEEFIKLNMPEIKMNEIFPVASLTYVITAYDGRALLDTNPAYMNLLPEKSVPIIKKGSLQKKPGTDDSEVITMLSNVDLTPVIIFRKTNFIPQSNSPVLFRKMIQIVKKIKRRLFDSTKKTRVLQPGLNSASAFLPHVFKQKVIKDYKEEYDIQVLIETGTYYGDMIEAQKKLFRQIYSIELSEALFQKAVDRFKHDSSIKILLGDSGHILKTILIGIEEPSIFWLDGHYSEGVTAKGELNTPILNELNHIFDHTIDSHVILIDDARCFIGENDYPSIESLKKFVNDKKPDLQFSVKDDIIRIHK